MNFIVSCLFLIFICNISSSIGDYVKCGSDKLQDEPLRDLLKLTLEQISRKVGQWENNQSPLYHKYGHNFSFYTKGSCIDMNEKCDQCIGSLVNRSATLCKNSVTGLIYDKKNECKIRWSNYSFVDFPAEERRPTKVVCSDLKLQPNEGYYFDILGQTFYLLFSSATNWQNDTNYSYNSTDSIFTVKGICFSKTKTECSKCVEGIVNQSWEKCANAHDGLITNMDCSVEWKKNE